MALPNDVEPTTSAWRITASFRDEWSFAIDSPIENKVDRYYHRRDYRFLP